MHVCRSVVRANAHLMLNEYAVSVFLFANQFRIKFLLPFI